MNRKLSIATLLLGFLSQSAGAVVLNGPDFPAPGGNSFGFVGDPGDPGGRDVTYTAFDIVTPGLINLWQGLWDSTSASAALDGTPDTLSFSGVAGPTGTWTGTTSWLDPDTSTFHPAVPIQMDITIIGGPVSWTVLPIPGVGFDPALGAVIDNSTGADYSINILFSADVPGPGGFAPINTFHQGTPGDTLASVSLGFYSTVPEPSTFMLGGVGLVAAVGCALVRRRRSA
jgi:hypothetical protein